MRSDILYSFISINKFGSFKNPLTTIPFFFLVIFLYAIVQKYLITWCAFTWHSPGYGNKKIWYTLIFFLLFWSEIFFIAFNKLFQKFSSWLEISEKISFISQKICESFVLEGCDLALDACMLAFCSAWSNIFNFFQHKIIFLFRFSSFILIFNSPQYLTYVR